MLGALQGFNLIGILLHGGGSVLIVYGQTLVKVGHCIEESSAAPSSWLLPKQPGASPPLWRRPDGRWRRQLAGSKAYAAAGWALFGVGNAMRFVSMRFAAQTVLSGLGSLQFVLIPIASRMLLGIRSQLTTVMGVATVLLGNVLIILYGPPEVSFTLRQLRAQWGTTAMEVFLVVLGGLLAGMQCLWWYITGQTHVGISLLGKLLAQGQKPEQQFLLSASSASSSPASEGSGGGGGGGKGEPQDAVQVFMGALLFSAVASFIGAWSVLFSKSLTYVVTALPGSLYDWYSWFVVAAFLGTAAFWVRQSDRGLRLYPASLIMPLMQAFWMCMSVVEGGIYFDELVILPANSLLLLMLGLVMALVGAVVMGIAGYISEKRDAALALAPRLGPLGADLECMELLTKNSSPVIGEAPHGGGGWAEGLQDGRVRLEGALTTPMHRGSGGAAGGASSSFGDLGKAQQGLAGSGGSGSGKGLLGGEPRLAAAGGHAHANGVLECAPPPREALVGAKEALLQSHPNLEAMPHGGLTPADQRIFIRSVSPRRVPPVGAAAASDSSSALLGVYQRVRQAFQ